MRPMKRLTSGLLSAASILCLSGVANAQSQSPAQPEGAQESAEQSAADNSDIVVTGSRVVSNVRNSPTPLTSATAEEITATTPASIPEGLKKLPVFQGGTGRASMVGGGQDGGTSNVLSLRSFGAERTLVLLDGHRVTPSSTSGTVNVDSLPQMLMSRVDVVTGGASAVYGSDAVTGVVNFILDKKFTGLKVNASYGISQDGEGAEKQIGVAGGFSLFGDRGHVLLSARTYHQDGVNNLDLPHGPALWSQSGSGLTPDNPLIQTRDTRFPFATFGGRIGSCGTGCDAAGLQFVSPGVLGPFTAGQTLPSTSNQSGGDGGYLTHNLAISGLTSRDLFGRFSYDFDNDITAYVNVSYAKTRNVSVYSDTLFFGTPQNYFKDNPYLPAATQTLLASGSGNTFSIGKFNPEVPGTTIIGTNRNFNVTTGLQGTIFDRFNWDLFYTYGKNRRVSEVEGSVNNMRLMAAQDAVINPANGQVVCQVSLTQYASRYPGCVPYNPFGPNTVTKAMRDYATETTAWFLTQHMQDFGGSVSGPLFDLPAGPLKVALSVEGRYTDLKVTNRFDPNSTVDCTGLRLCDPAAPPAYWSGTIVQNVPKISSNVWEAALEANIPLLKDIPLVQDLSLNIAGRYTDYSTSGVVKTWKVGANWALSDDLRFRATRSRDIRAPSLFDLYGPVNTFPRTFEDPHVLDAQGNPTSYQVIAQTGSNPNLVPEVANTTTIGAVLTPSFIPRLSIAVDWYSIKMNNALSSIGGNDAAVKNLCESSGGTHPVCDLYVRPLAFSDRTAANRATIVKSVLLNSASTKLEGIDFEVNYNIDGSEMGIPGTFDLRLLANRSLKNEFQSFEGQPKTFAVGSKTVATLFLNYRVDDWTFSVQDSWRSGFSKNSDNTTIYFSPDRVPSYNIVDASIAKKLKIGKMETELYLNVQNVFDRPGPVFAQFSLWGFFYPVPNTQYGNPVYGNYPVLGRFFTAGLRAKL